ncbi:uncharacterized protein METZ01_LOCUS113116 [marine metagenome]|uniref:Bacteriophage T4 Gp32 single-stranded DNA-binding domain-containing protein n=1 Tax=marine metagenome TaxID=408172 RepID=A0A381X6T2_9ZZZZ
MASFKDLKKNRMSNLESLSKQVEKLAEKPSYEDDRIWKCERDKSGNGYAVIRFLPASNNEDVPWVQLWSHGFKGPGGWYIENSLTTLGKDDPVSKANTALWNSGIESDKNIARDRKRKLSYYSNILVLEDSANAENEGKVFLFRYGKKIFEKITSVMNPEFKDETPLNPFDFWAGANFKIKIRQVEGYANYDKSEFATPSALYEGNDAKCEEVWKQQYLLKEFVSPDNFKSYQELEARFNTVIAHQGEEYTGNVEEAAEQPTANKEGDDSLEYFKKLAEQ